METRKVSTKQENKEFRRHRQKTECLQDRVCVTSSSEVLFVENCTVETEFTLRKIASSVVKEQPTEANIIVLDALRTSESPSTEVKANCSQENDDEELRDVETEYPKSDNSETERDACTNVKDFAVNASGSFDDLPVEVDSGQILPDENATVNGDTASQQCSNEAQRLECGNICVQNVIVGNSLDKKDDEYPSRNISDESEVVKQPRSSPHMDDLIKPIDSRENGDEFPADDLVRIGVKTSPKSPIQHTLANKNCDISSHESSIQHRMPDKRKKARTNSLVHLANIRSEGSVQKLVKFFETLTSYEEEVMPCPHAAKPSNRQISGDQIDCENVLLQKFSHQQQLDAHSNQCNKFQDQANELARKAIKNWRREGFKSCQGAVHQEVQQDQRPSHLVKNSGASHSGDCQHDRGFPQLNPRADRFSNSAYAVSSSPENNYPSYLQHQNENRNEEWLFENVILEMEDRTGFIGRAKRNAKLTNFKNPIAVEKTSDPEVACASNDVHNLQNTLSGNLCKRMATISDEARSPACKNNNLKSVHRGKSSFSITSVGELIPDGNRPQCPPHKYSPEISDGIDEKQHLRSVQREKSPFTITSVGESISDVNRSQCPTHECSPENSDGIAKKQHSRSVYRRTFTIPRGGEPISNGNRLHECIPEISDGIDEAQHSQSDSRKMGNSIIVELELNQAACKTRNWDGKTKNNSTDEFQINSEKSVVGKKQGNCQKLYSTLNPAECFSPVSKTKREGVINYFWRTLALLVCVASICLSGPTFLRAISP